MLILVPTLVNAQGIDDPGGIPLYVIIEVNWDGQSPTGDWTVYGPAFNPVLHGSTVLAACTNCLEMNYDFVFRGKTLQFDENFVTNVEATPQSKHVVLHDDDGDGVYTGSNSAHHYFPWVEGSALLYFDRLDYTVVTDGNGNITGFSYIQYEHKKLIPAEG
jgi:hypothetical protein